MVFKQSFKFQFNGTASSNGNTQKNGFFGNFFKRNNKEQETQEQTPNPIMECFGDNVEGGMVLDVDVEEELSIEEMKELIQLYKDEYEILGRLADKVPEYIKSYSTAIREEVSEWNKQDREDRASDLKAELERDDIRKAAESK